MKTATEFFKFIKQESRFYGQTVPLTGEEALNLPRKGGRFKVKGGILIVRPIETQYGKGHVTPFGAEATISNGRIVISHWETEEV